MLGVGAPAINFCQRNVGEGGEISHDRGGEKGAIFRAFFSFVIKGRFPKFPRSAPATAYIRLYAYTLR